MDTAFAMMRVQESAKVRARACRAGRWQPPPRLGDVGERGARMLDVVAEHSGELMPGEPLLVAEPGRPDPAPRRRPVPRRPRRRRARCSPPWPPASRPTCRSWPCASATRWPAATSRRWPRRTYVAAGGAAHFLVAGDLHLHLGHAPELARARYEQALTMAPDYAPALLALAGLHDGDGERGADGEQPGTGFRTHVLEQLVELYQRTDGPGGRLDQVAAALRRLVALDPEDCARARWRLVDALAVYDRPERREERAALAELTAQLDAPDQRAAGAARGGARRPGPAGCTGPTARSRPPGDRSGMARFDLLQLLVADARARAGRWEELAAGAPRRGGRAGRRLGDGWATARREVAALLAQRLDQPAEAAEIYRELCGRDPDGVVALAEAQRACKGRLGVDLRRRRLGGLSAFAPRARPTFFEAAAPRAGADEDERGIHELHP